MTGLSFEEVMTGRLAPQSLDASEGYDEVSAVAASMSANIDILDLNVFIAFRDRHRGRLRATVTIPVLGEHSFTADDGVFELFRPGQNPDDGGSARLMVYDAFLTGNDRVYLMRGRKYLKPRRFWPVRLWLETTTLEVELRDVTRGGRVDVGPADEDAPGCGDSFEEIPRALRAKMDPAKGIPPWLENKRDIVRANGEKRYRRDFGRPAYLSGVLRLSPGGFIRQLTTMHATAGPGYRRPLAVLRFQMFFASSLARIYLLRDGSQPPT